MPGPAAAHYLCDGSFEGFLSALSASIRAGQRNAVFTSDEGDGGLLFDGRARLHPDPKEADALWRRLSEVLTPHSLARVVNAWRSEAPGVENLLAAYIRLGLEHGAGLDLMHADPNVLSVQKLARKVEVEIHRMRGLLRFRELRVGMLYAPMSPDHDILQPVAHLFTARLRGERWAIHDVRRALALAWDGARLVPATTGDSFSADTLDKWLSDDEARWQQAWRSFHSAVSIPGRRNPALQRKLMPARYWRHLVETAG